MKLKLGSYFIDCQPLYTMIAKVIKIDGERVYFKPLNFDDWNEKLDWFHYKSVRANHVHIITEDDAMEKLKNDKSFCWEDTK